MQGMYRKLTLKGNTTTQGETFQAELDQVKRLIAFGALYTFLVALLLELTLTVTNNTGGQITVGWEHLYDVVKGVDFNFKAAQKHLLELTTVGGQALWQSFYVKHGRLPDVQSDVVINNGATATIYLKLPITFYDLRGDDPEDEIIWSDFLVDSTLDVTYNGSATLFAASTTWAITSCTLNAYAVPRTKIFHPTLVRTKEWTIQALPDDTWPLNGTYPMDVILTPVTGNASATSKFAAADITNVRVTQDGTIVVDHNPTTIQAMENLQAICSAERLSQWESGSNRALYLRSMDKANGQKSKLLYASRRPEVSITGAVAATAGKYIGRFVHPSGLNQVISTFQSIGMSVSPGELVPKTTFKNPIRDKSILQVCPWLYVPAPAKAAA
jgi:hypothetical protein